MLLSATVATASDWRPVIAPLTIGGHYYEPASAASNHQAIQLSKSQTALLRFTVRRGENSRWDAKEGSAVDRAELTGWAQPNPLGKDVWISYAQRILPGEPVTSRWCVIGQMHATTQAGDRGSSPPFALQLLPGDVFMISTRYVAAARHTVNPDETIRYSGAIERDRWYRHVFRLRFGYKGDAILQWWRDGVLMLDLTDFSMGYNDPEGPYWQFGIYRNTSPEDLTIEYRDVEVSQTSLAHRIAPPLSKETASDLKLMR
ncbi:heparin lyase I family protein [Microvirga lenta]|uniref:heparin lyase I family protein n=1 Tax=Microvirga lenta TaxID=2881337 RepID=UPI001CFC5E2C|nr:heparin lyase I family protein [Microvirga lenta]MCB5173882.1 polysaccharide lyase [Microvirga lenta]